MKKKNICVIFGGQSSEHEVSLVSASFVMENIDKERYHLYPVGITKEGRWYYFEGETEEVKNNTWLASGKIKQAFIPPDAGVGGLVVLDGGRYKTVPIDCAFPVLHGLWGEDGTIQGLFELARIPYVGCGVASSANAMDKVFSRTLFDAQKIPQAKWDWCRKKDFCERKEEILERLEKRFPYPMFVKPANAGSSVGVSKAKDRRELNAALEMAFCHDKKAVVEEFVDGREIEVSVLYDGKPFVSVCGEVIPAKEFYDYEAKYQDENSKLLIPAPLTEKEYAAVKGIAIKAFEAIDCRGIARVDFFIRRKDGRVILNEINTMPGFTGISMYPKLMAYSGVSARELVTRLIEME